MKFYLLKRGIGATGRTIEIGYPKYREATIYDLCEALEYAVNLDGWKWDGGRWVTPEEQKSIAEGEELAKCL